MRWLPWLAWLGLLGCARQPETCHEIATAQRTSSDRVITCRQDEMATALGMCALDPPIIPKDSSRTGLLGKAWDMPVDECLRHWVKVYDACEDEADMQYRCMPKKR